MGKRIWLITVVFILVFTAGCEFTPTEVPSETQPTQSGPSLSDIATLSALSTQIHHTPEEGVNLETPTPTIEGAGETTITNTPMPGSIVIKSIVEKSQDSALITWDVSGDFPSGFRVVWSDQQGLPTFPENNSLIVGSSTARSALINVVPGMIYYVRVCRYLKDTCDIYSDLGIFAFTPSTATPDLNPAKTATAAAAIKTSTAAAIIKKTSTALNYDPTLVITLMKGGEAGKAYMAWTDTVGTSKGYKIVFSKTSSTPTLGTGNYFYVSDSAARSAYVDGDSNTKYYYRICRYNGSTCTAYSATYTFTFPTYSAATATTDASTITITGITDTGTGGVAQVSWTASGTFSNGFKILYSKTTALPTLSDNVVVVSDGDLRIGTITGDPATLYHVRVCKYSGSACTVYSPVYDFTFGADPAVIAITEISENTAGSVDLTWTATGTFTNGFKILYSTNATPDMTNSNFMAIGSSATRSATVTVSVDQPYYFRVCKFNGTTCTVYSNIVQFTTSTTAMVLTYTDPNYNDYTWELVPDNDADNTDGYYLFWASGTITPVWSSGLTTQMSATADLRTLTISPALTPGKYVVRACLVTGTACSTYSNTIEIEVPEP